MKLAGIGTAGTLESSDMIISIEGSSESGLKIELSSPVYKQFGPQIMELIKTTLTEMGVKDAIVHAQDKGALDYTIIARTKTAASRAAELKKSNWGDA